MKKIKEGFMVLFGVLALSFSIINFYAPSKAFAASGKQWVLTSCITHYCNDCYPGTNWCLDNTCSQCKPSVPDQ